MRTSLLLRRYTDIPSLIQTLTTKEITLLDPDRWEDQNDAKFLAQYKAHKNIKTLLALCLTTTGETHHHWSEFAPNNSGIVIRFFTKKLLEDINNKQASVNDTENIMHNVVKYKNIKALKKSGLSVENIPFTKRYPYRFEKEYRIIYVNENEEKKIFKIPIKIESIKEIVINPWIHKSLIPPLQNLLKSIDGCANIKIFQTTIHENSNWIDISVKAES